MNKLERDYKKLLRLYEAYVEELQEYFDKYPVAVTEGNEGPGSNPPPPPPPPPTNG